MCVNVYGNEIGRELLKETWTTQSLGSQCTLKSIFQVENFVCSEKLWILESPLWTDGAGNEIYSQKLKQIKKVLRLLTDGVETSKDSIPFNICLFLQNLSFSFFILLIEMSECDVERWWSFNFVMTMRVCEYNFGIFMASSMSGLYLY